MIRRSGYPGARVQNIESHRSAQNFQESIPPSELSGRILLIEFPNIHPRRAQLQPQDPL